MKYCKVRSIASLDNEYGFTQCVDGELINLDLFAEKRTIERYAEEVFANEVSDNSNEILWNSIRRKCVELKKSNGSCYCFTWGMLVNGRVMDSETDGVVFDDVL